MRVFSSEREFTRWVIANAMDRGWLTAHPPNLRAVRRRDGTVVSVPDRNSIGFPDLVFVHEKHGVVWAELKMRGRKPEQAQVFWLRALRGAGQAVYVWTPDDQAEVLAVLEGRPPTGRLFGEPAITTGGDE